MESVIRGISVYVILLVIVRLSGRRTLAQMTPFDVVLLLIVAETTQQALLGDDFSITNAVVLIVTLFTTDIALSFLKQWSKTLAVFIDGSPTVLVAKGQPDWQAMRRARIGLDDILAAARVSQGLKSLDEVDFAVLEESGGISIIPARQAG